jgi:hypothetical protein
VSEPRQFVLEGADVGAAVAELQVAVERHARVQAEQRPFVDVGHDRARVEAVARCAGASGEDSADRARHADGVAADERDLHLATVVERAGCRRRRVAGRRGGEHGRRFDRGQPDREAGPRRDERDPAHRRDGDDVCLHLCPDPTAKPTRVKQSWASGESASNGNGSSLSRSDFSAASS